MAIDVTTTGNVDANADTTTTNTTNTNGATASSLDRIQQFNNGNPIVGTVDPGVTVSGAGLELLQQAPTPTAASMANDGTVSSTLSGLAAMQLTGNGGPVTYTGTATSAVTGTGGASGLALNNVLPGVGDVTATVNGDVSGGVGIVATQFAAGGIGNVLVEVGTTTQTDITGTGTANYTGPGPSVDAGNGIYAKNYGDASVGGGGSAVVTLGTSSTVSATAGTNLSVSGILAESVSGDASVTTGATTGITVTGNGTGSNSGIYAASGATAAAGFNTVSVLTGTGSTINVNGGVDNSGIFARNESDLGVSDGNISITTGSGSTINVGNLTPSTPGEGIGAYTEETLTTTTDINILANGGGSAINVTGNDVSGISARQRAAGGSGDVFVTTFSGHTITVTDDTAGGTGSFGINATNSGTGKVTVAVAGTINSAGAGAADVVGINAAAGTGDITVNVDASPFVSGGTAVQISGSSANNTVDLSVSLAGATGIRVAGGTTTVKSTSGATILNGTTAALDIDSGKLVIGSGTIALNGNVINDGTLAINRADAFTIFHVVSGTGSFEQTGAGTTTLTGTNTYAGGTTISAGTLQLGNGSTTGSITGNVTDNAILAINRSNTFTFAGDISGTGALQQNGTGTTILSGANTYAGITNVTAGVLNIQNNTGLGAVTGGVDVSGGATLALQSGITVGAEALSISGTGVGTNGALRNISGANTYGGTVTLTGNARINSDADSLTLSAANSVTAGANQNLTIGGAGDGTISGTITTGTGGLTKDGAGSWTLAGANTYSGATNVNAGTLIVNGSIANSATTVASGATIKGSGNVGDLTVQSGATFAPGNSAGITTTGDFTLNSGATLEIEIEGAGGPGVGGYDQVIVNGDVTLAGNLSVLPLGGFHRATGDLLTIILNNGTNAVTGTFANVGPTFTQSGNTFSITYTGGGGDNNDVVLTALNDGPVTDLNDGGVGDDNTAAFTEQTPVLIAPVGTITDVDDTNMESLTATLSPRPDGAAESLQLNATATAAAVGLTVLYTPGTGVLSITGSASTTTYQTILRGIEYNNTSDTPTITARNVDVTVNDGDASSTVNNVTISVTATNDAPVTDLNGTGTGGDDATASFTEQTPVVIAPVATVTDADDTDLELLTATLTNRPDGDGVELLSLNAAAATAAAGAGFRAAALSRVERAEELDRLEDMGVGERTGPKRRALHVLVDGQPRLGIGGDGRGNASQPEPGGIFQEAVFRSQAVPPVVRVREVELGHEPPAVGTEGDDPVVAAGAAFLLALDVRGQPAAVAEQPAREDDDVGGHERSSSRASSEKPRTLSRPWRPAWLPSGSNKMRRVRPERTPRAGPRAGRRRRPHSRGTRCAGSSPRARSRGRRGWPRPRGAARQSRPGPPRAGRGRRRGGRGAADSAERAP